VFTAALALATLGFIPGLTQSANAYDPHACDYLPLTAGATHWNTLFADRGVTYCGSVNASGDWRVFIQIIDLDQGASVSLKGVPDHSSNNGQQDTKYYKLTADEWFTVLNSPAFHQNVNNPYGPNYASAKLFSVSNAGFFADNIPLLNASTEMSFPQGLMYYDPAPGVNAWQVAKLQDGTVYKSAHDATPGIYDQAWDANKIAIAINHPSQYCAPSLAPAGSGLSRVEMHPFAIHYTLTDATNFLWTDPYSQPISYCHIFGDQFVGLDPTWNASGEARRTYFGVDNPSNAHKIFILNSQQHLTGSVAEQMLHSAGAGGQYGSVAQLDGGGSTQLDVDVDGDGTGSYALHSDDLIYRKVPTVLAVYLGASD
jgi:hypothetical protein